MKKIVFGALMLFCCMGAISLHAQRKETSFGIPASSVTVNVSLQKAPVFSIDSKKVSPGRSGNLGSFSKVWLVNEVTFSFQLTREIRRYEAYPVNALSIEMYICVPTTGRNPSLRWFYGEQKLNTLVIAPAYKSQRFMASLFMPPCYVFPYLPKEKNGKYNLKNLEGVIIFKDSNGRILGKKAFSYTKKLTTKRADALFSSVERLQNQLPIMLWPREKTPWEWVDADRFELPLTAIANEKTVETKTVSEDKEGK